MPRAIWSGSISFGLVNIPVKLFNAVSRKTVRFNQIDTPHRRAHQAEAGVGGQTATRCPTRRSSRATSCRRASTCSSTTTSSPPSIPRPRARSTSRSSSTSPTSTRSSTTPPTTSPPTRRRSSRTRCWPRRWRSRSKVGIARFVMRSKQYLAAIRPEGRQAAAVDDGLRRRGQRPGRDPRARRRRAASSVSDKELAMAEQLIESLSADFEPEKFDDTYREQVLDLIERKAAGETEIVAAPRAGRAPTRSSTSWPRSRRAWPRPRRPASATRPAGPADDVDGRRRGRSRRRRPAAKKAAPRSASGSRPERPSRQASCLSDDRRRDRRAARSSCRTSTRCCTPRSGSPRAR